MFNTTTAAAAAPHTHAHKKSQTNDNKNNILVSFSHARLYLPCCHSAILNRLLRREILSLKTGRTATDIEHRFRYPESVKDVVSWKRRLEESLECHYRVIGSTMESLVPGFSQVHPVTDDEGLRVLI